jgi:hypothetical protein
MSKFLERFLFRKNYYVADGPISAHGVREVRVVHVDMGRVSKLIRDADFDAAEVYRSIYERADITYREIAVAIEVALFEKETGDHPTWKQLKDRVQDHLDQSRQSADTAITDAYKTGVVTVFMGTEFERGKLETWQFCLNDDQKDNQQEKLCKVESSLRDIYLKLARQLNPDSAVLTPAIGPKPTVRKA